jgi:hypothetical protein
LGLFAGFFGFVIPDRPAYIGRHAPQANRIPPAVARRFVEDLRAFFAEKNTIKTDEIAARQLHALR